ncbi:SGNH/GDSL hydrolase family protein [Flavobacterium sp. UBA7663]|uniref:SGNH/GDSL hydrolase family protein n=1 Tax=Flavobacterium sp. UBA7663 TaxID=1946557 RepID=UPI0025BCA6E5|nr:SGNH/GDSL hydrolase family protein [Flavobacterium sp. UBA7663]
MKKILIALYILLLTVSCQSTDPSPGLSVIVIPKRLNIVVIGNSITSHLPSTDIGWFNDWGMAASSPTNDFCGVLSIKNNVEKLRVPYWEIQFDETEFPPAPAKKIDVLVIQFGENVGSENFLKFEQTLPELIMRYKQNNTRVMLVSNFWYDEEKDLIEKNVCEQYGYEFIDISEVHGDLSYEAIDEFENDAVAAHPNDKGMKFIAERILEKL